MADNYECCNSRSAGSSEETAVSTSQGFPSPCESMWEGWTQTSSAADSTITDQMPQHLGSSSGSTSATSGSSYQHDLLSCWLMSGFQSTGSHPVGQHGEGGYGVNMYPDDFSRLNICSSSSNHGPVAGGSDTPQGQQLQYVPGPCSSSVQTNCTNSEREAELESGRFLNATSAPGTAGNLHAHGTATTSQQMLQQTSGNSRASSSSTPAGFQSSYGQMMQHLVGPFDSSSGWTATSSGVHAATSSPQPSDCSGAVMQSTGQQQEVDLNASSERLALHHNHSRKEAAGNGVTYTNPVMELTDQIYAELHGLLQTKNLHGPPGGATASDHHLQAIGASAASSYGGHSSWTHFATEAPSHHVGGFSKEADQTMFSADALSSAAGAQKRGDVSPSSAGTAISTIHNLSTADGQLSPYTYGCLDLESSELRRKRLSRGEEDGESSSVTAEVSAKRACIEHHRNFWQLQSQALFGRIPGNFLLGSSSSSGSMDINAAVGPALNTNGRPRARRGSATDPQSVYARHRRERINDRLKILQHLVPNGAKVDIVTMLEEAIHYVKFLQLQVRFLSSDELWIHAPTTYNGVDVSMSMHPGFYNQQP